MIVSRSAFLLLCLAYPSESERVKIQAKKLIKGKVIANGYSVAAKSLPRCIEHCNMREDTCDGVVYHEIIGKCRLIKKCAPAFQVDNSSSVVYYSRRPQSKSALHIRSVSINLNYVKSRGFVHDPETDSCLGLITSQANYPTAEALCAKENADLAVLNSRKLNDLGKGLLSNASSDWAWIKDDNVAHEEETVPHGISGNDVLPEEVFSPDVVQWRNASTRSCWGLNKSGQWGQFSCKNSTMLILCQVPRFNV